MTTVYTDRISFEDAMAKGKGCDVWPKAGDYTERTGRALIALHTSVWLMQETRDMTPGQTRVFASREAAMAAGRSVIEDYRNNSRVADEIDEVLAYFNETGGAGDGSCVFYVDVSPFDIE